MQQPELGKQLSILRKEKNLTQEELVEKSHVSVRTIQRIEAGEVLPRMSTVKILLEALGVDFETFSQQFSDMPQQNNKPVGDRNVMLVAVLAGGVYLVLEILLGVLDISWFTSDRSWGIVMNTVYTVASVLLVAAFGLFARGFIVLSALFENSLLKIAIYLAVFGVIVRAALNIFSLGFDDLETLWLPYVMLSLLMGAISIVFGVSLIRLQDGMGELSRAAGILEIIMGCMLVTVFLFFLTYVVMVPAVVVEILILYRGYEYLSKPQSAPA